MTTYKIAFNLADEFANQKLEHGSPNWARFNDGFENLELDLIDILYYIHAGYAYTTWHYDRRKSTHFVCGQHIAIDMDTEDSRSTIQEISQNMMMRLYGGIVHTTPSHTLPSPRARAIFLLDEPIVSPEGYKAATQTIMTLFDGHDRVCKDPSRFFYGAKDCQYWYDTNELPLNRLRHMYQTTMAKTPPTTLRTPYVPQGGDTDMARVEQALTYIDPWSIDYDKWIAILAALHDEYGDSGVTVAEHWGQGKDGEVRKKWKSFGRYNGPRASLGSIFQIAIERGYRDENRRYP